MNIISDYYVGKLLNAIGEDSNVFYDWMRGQTVPMGGYYMYDVVRFIERQQKDKCPTEMN